MKIVNKKAYHDYQILDKIEAGVVLTGAEAKSVRAGRAQLSGAYVRILNNEVWLVNAVVPEYEFSKQENYQPDRTRKLLLSKKEILHLSQKVQTKGITLVPLALFTQKGLVKVTVGLVKGKKEFEKKEMKKKKDLQREVEREMKNF